MNQTIFSSDSTGAVRELLIAIRRKVRAVLLAIRPCAAEFLILGAMLVGVIALKLVQIAVSNPGVANVLSTGRVFF
ncbi:MAG: hypothetical protein JSS40_13765 [Proteobacteria bacterium]|nr:hypothetical protein [Pseudomonadota bacterium]